MVAPAQAPGRQVLIKQVIDGDTVVVAPAQGEPVTVRLAQIDAPELCQPWGADARKALAELAEGKLATLRAQSQDRQGRTVGQLFIDELDIARHQVENGHAWSLRTRYDRGPLVKQERMAKALSRGLHSQGGALPPWEFRRRTVCPPP